MTTGLLITYNEQHFLPYSIPVLLQVVDKIVVLDASTDNSRNILSKFDNIIVYYEEDYPEIKTYRDRRQFVLNRAREISIDNKYVVIDADEILSQELIDYLNTNDWGDAIYCRWWHIGSKFNSVNDTRINDTQGIAFIDNGVDYHGNEYVHEDKIPISRNEIYTSVDYPLFHFGMCDMEYVNIKESYYKCLLVNEGYPKYRINLDFLNNNSNMKFKVFDNYHYPIFIDDSITSIDKSMKIKFFKLVESKFNLYYDLDIWFDDLVEDCKNRCINFNENKIISSWNESKRVKYIKFMWKGFKYNFKNRNFSSIFYGVIEIIRYFRYIK